MMVTVARCLELDSPALTLTDGLINNVSNFRGAFMGSLAHKLPCFRLAEDGSAPVFGAVLLAVKHGTGSVSAMSFIKMTPSKQCDFS